MKNVPVSAGQSGQAIARWVGGGKYVVLAGLRCENAGAIKLHLAIQESLAGKPVDGLEHVTDESHQP